MPALSFRKRLLLSYAGGFVVLLLITGYGVSLYRQALATLTAQQKTLLAKQLLMKRIELYYAKQNQAWANILLRGDDADSYHRALSDFYENERNTLSYSQQLLDELKNEPILLEKVKSLYESLRHLRKQYREALHIYNGTKDSQAATDQFLKISTQDPSSQLDILQSHIVADNEQKQAVLQQSLKNYDIYILVGVLGAVVVQLLLTLWFIDKYFATPLTHAMETARKVASGEIDQRIHVMPEGEFKIFSQSFNFMLDKLQRSKIKLEATNKELEAFAYSVSHDLRAPLRAIDGFSNALQEDYADRLDKTGKNFLDRIRAGTLNMGILIDDLLKLTRITRTTLQPALVDLSELAQNIITTLHNRDPQRTVQVDIAQDLQVMGDKGLLTIMLENLLNNAWKYTNKSANPYIQFDTMKQHDETVFHVRDNGAGFDMNYAGKLFGPFQRLHHRNEFEGSGIGLATVKRIVHLHGGKIWAEAQPEKGATFFFTLDSGERN